MLKNILRKRFFPQIILILLANGLLVVAASYASIKSADNQPIVIGMSTALTGAAQAIGQDVKRGVEIYFAKVNAAGGINGRPLELLALDDQYEPVLAGQNMRILTQNPEVLAVIGNVGTPTSIVTIPIANEQHILLFAPFTGANAARKVPPDRYVINLRASYEEETTAMINGLLSIGIKPEEMAFFLQNDSYGDSGYQGAIKALKKAGYVNLEKIPIARYSRNTLNIERGLSILLDTSTPPKAIIIVGAYAPSAKFTILAKKEFPNALFLNVSFVGSMALLHALGNNSENIIVTQVVPSLDSNEPAISDYRNDLKKYGAGAAPYFGSLEGYLDAKLFVIGLLEAAAKNKLDREGIIDTFEQMQNVDIGISEKITLDKYHHQALNKVWPTIIKNGKFLPLNWLELKH
jgi:branched-chain amino acid transport system substrate-binding protein